MEHWSYRKDNISSNGTQAGGLTEMLDTKQTVSKPEREEHGKNILSPQK